MCSCQLASLQCAELSVSGKRADCYCRYGQIERSIAQGSDILSAHLPTPQHSPTREIKRGQNSSRLASRETSQIEVVTGNREIRAGVSASITPQLLATSSSQSHNLTLRSRRIEHAVIQRQPAIGSLTRFTPQKRSSGIANLNYIGRRALDKIECPRFNVA